MARKSYDPLMNLMDITSGPIIKLLARTPITSVQTTLLGFFACVLPSAYLLSTGGYLQGIIAIILLFLASWLDFADGAIGRIKNTSSPLGAWIDPAIDLVAQAVILLGIIFGGYNITGEEIWLIFGLFALFGLLASNFIGLEYVHKFGFSSYVGLPAFIEEFNKFKKRSLLDRFLKQIIMPTNPLSIFLFTIRYFVIMGVVFHTYWLSTFLLAILLNFRWIVMFVLYGLSLTPEKSRFVVVEVLKRIRKGQMV